MKNFKYFDDLIHSGVKEIILDSEIVLDYDEESKYREGIRLDVDEIIINGNGHSIDAKGMARIFNITGKNIFIYNIKFRNGFTDTNGGAIRIDDASVAFHNALFHNNGAKYNGGAVFNKNGSLDIIGSDLFGNSSKNNGGAIFSQNGEVNVIRCSLFRNDSTRAAAIYLNCADLNVTESRFHHNHSKKTGGAIKAIDGDIKVSDCEFAENSAEYGAAIYLFDSFLEIADSDFICNSVEKEGGAIYGYRGKSKIKNTIFDANSSKERGGAIRSFYGSLSLTDCILSGNSVESRYYGGGAIYNYDAILKVQECAFLHNASNAYGGAIYDDSFNTRVNISKSRFCDNVAERGGAIAISSYESTITIDQGVFFQ